MEPTTPDDPTWQDQASGASALITCECNYALQGSSPQCDFDRTEERNYSVPTPNLRETCRRGKNLCDDSCERVFRN